MPRPRRLHNHHRRRQVHRFKVVYRVRNRSRLQVRHFDARINQQQGPAALPRMNAEPQILTGHSPPHMVAKQWCERIGPSLLEDPEAHQDHRKTGVLASINTSSAAAFFISDQSNGSTM